MKLTNSREPASSVAYRIAKRAAKRTLLPLFLSCVLLSTWAALYASQRMTTQKSEAVSSQIKSALRTGDTLTLNRVIDSLNADGSYLDVVLTSEDQATITSYKQIHNPYLISSGFKRLPNEERSSFLDTFMPIEVNGVGRFELRFSNRFPYRILLETVLVALILVIFFWLILLRSMRALGNELVLPIGRFGNSIELSLSSSDPIAELVNVSLENYQELNEASAKFRQLLITVRTLERETLKYESHRILVEHSTQVAHDIRSPLSALNLVIGTSRELSDEKRELVQNAVKRINEIANDLLKFSKLSHGKGSASFATPEQPLLISDVLEAILEEKKIQFAESSGVVVVGDFEGGKDLFARVSRSELARVISNLLNNSFEALIGRRGTVKLGIEQDDGEILVTVIDNGAGIPPHILNRLGERGFSYGKKSTQSGSGLGIFHARAIVGRAGGRMQISSELSKGTRIELRFPQVRA